MKSTEERLQEFIDRGMGRVAYIFLERKGIRPTDFLRLIKEYGVGGVGCINMIFNYLSKETIEKILKKI